MAEIAEKEPTVGTSDSLTKAVVTYLVPELKVDSYFGSIRSGKPKNGEASIKFDSRSIQFSLALTVNGREIKYAHTAKKLPGEIDPEKSTKKFYTGKVVLTLVKAREESWEAALSSTGLDIE